MPLRQPLAPLRRASDSPIATACLRLLTFLPLRPLFSVPFLRLRIAFFTYFDAFLEYLRAMLGSTATINALDNKVKWSQFR